MTERPGWDFDYAPVPTAAPDDDGGACDVVVATRGPVSAGRIAATLATKLANVEVRSLVARAPLFWVRVRSTTPARRADVHAWLEALGVRYVASATRGSQAVGLTADWSLGTPARATSWRTRAESAGVEPIASDGRWYLREGEGGVAIDRRHCGTGARTRLAVIDDDALDAQMVGLDALVMIGTDAPPKATFHGPLLIGWAVGTVTTRDDPSASFRGVAPDASPRLYCIPKAGTDVCSLAAAIVRAVDDGADVVLCPTYVEGSTSPMLDDALELARRCGRGGRGTAVVIPTGREASSPAHSLHSSWSLALRDPASDPRVFCIGPSGRGGAWFLWRNRKGRLHPFGNRGPAVRWLAPGDDVAYPFEARERSFHAESSGAAAIAAGVLLLVLGRNSQLRVSELATIVTRTCEPARAVTSAPIADAYDLLPTERDADGHDAKHGYGLVHATRACLAAVDPVSFTLVSMGDVDAASRFVALRARRGPLARVYSRRLARACVRALLEDPEALHAASVLARHVRLLAAHAERRLAHGDGALTRSLVLLLRQLAAPTGHPRPTGRVREELERLGSHLRECSARAHGGGVEGRIFQAIEALWPDSSPRGKPAVAIAHEATDA